MNASHPLSSPPAAPGLDATRPVSQAIFQTSPGHLRATAYLYGLDTVPLARARVLELGCQSGGNLLPFALAYPTARVVGVDASPERIAAGRQVAAAVGASNLDLRVMALEDIDAALGHFDYVIAHGLYGSASPETRTTLLHVIRDHLAPAGIAYVNYPTYPGTVAEDLVNTALSMLSHGAPDSEARRASAKAALTLLADSQAAANPLAPALRAAAQHLLTRPDEEIVRASLQGSEAPCYFQSFAKAVRHAGLGYVGDAQAQIEAITLPDSLAAPMAPAEPGASAKILRQQALDFVAGRRQRESLLTHAERADAASDAPDLTRLADLRMAECFTPFSPKDAAPGEHHFKNSRARAFKIKDTAALPVLSALNQAWPRACGLADLVAATQGQTGVPAAAHADKVTRILQTLYRQGLVYIAREDPPQASREPEPDSAPRVLPGLVHLWQRSQDTPPERLISGFNLWHDAIDLRRLPPTAAWVLTRLGGRLSLSGLQTQLREALQRGSVPDLDGTLLTGQRDLDAKARQVLERVLQMLWRVGMRVG